MPEIGAGDENGRMPHHVRLGPPEDSLVTEADTLQHVLYAFSMLLPIALAVLLAWVVSGHGSRLGEEERCFNVLERLDTSACDRVPLAVRANIVVQMSLTAVMTVAVIRRRHHPLQALLIVDAAALACAVTYLVLRSWDLIGGG